MVSTMERPARGIARLRAESTPLGVVAAAAGGVSLLLVVAGSLAVLASRGLTPVPVLVTGLRSGALRVTLLGGAAAGAGAIALGFGTYRRMPTRVAREEAIAGAVLGIQALTLGVVLWLFTRGDVETLARNVFDFGQIRPQVGAFLRGAQNTVLLAAVGEAIGIGLGLVLAIFAISRRAVVRAPARVYINFFRGTPLIWQLSFLSFGLALALKLNFSAYTTAIVVFGLNSGAYTAEVFRAGIQSVERGQMEAARGLGMTYLQAMRYAIVPQAFRRVIPPLMNEFVILIKDTSLVIVLGLAERERELMSVGQQGYANSFNATFFVATAVGYLVVSLPLIRLVNAMERRLRSGLVGVSGA